MVTAGGDTPARPTRTRHLIAVLLFVSVVINYYREHQVVDIILQATRAADFHGSPRREPRGELTMCRKTRAIAP